MTSVIIPHFNDLDNLRICLQLLAAQSMPRERFEIVIAENNSQCGIAAIDAAVFGLARIVRAPIQGAAEARNAGVRASRGRILAFIDSDCRPSCDWLERGVAALAHADMVGGHVEVDVADASNPSAVEAFELVFAFNTERYVKEVGFSVTANMFVSRAIFDEVGWFRQGVPEDIDWGIRSITLGYCWRYESDVEVSHPARRDWGELTRKWRRLTREAHVAAKERRFGQLRWLLSGWLVLFAPFLRSSAVLKSNKLCSFKLRLMAIDVLIRLSCWRFRENYLVIFTDRRSIAHNTRRAG